MAKYGNTLKNSHEYSSLDLEKPSVENYLSELTGDVEALKYLDLATLEREGLGMYIHYLTGDYNSTNQASLADDTRQQQHQQQCTSVDYHPHIIHHSSTHTTITINSGTRICSYCGQPIQRFQLRT